MGAWGHGILDCDTALDGMWLAEQYKGGPISYLRDEMYNLLTPYKFEQVLAVAETCMDKGIWIPETVKVGIRKAVKIALKEANSYKNPGSRVTVLNKFLVRLNSYT